jgi:hypothetical protein
METDSPVTSVIDEDVVENVSVLVVLTTCNNFPVVNVVHTGAEPEPPEVNT